MLRGGERQSAVASPRLTWPLRGGMTWKRLKGYTSYFVIRRGS